MLSFLRLTRLHNMVGNVIKSSQDSMSISKRLCNLLGVYSVKLFPILHMIKDSFCKCGNSRIDVLIEDIETCSNLMVVRPDKYCGEGKF